MKKPYINHFIIEVTLTSGVISDISNHLFDHLISCLNLKVVNSCDHTFNNGGFTKVNILSTSHISLHTWPENSYFHIDLLTCNKTVTKSAVEDCLKNFIATNNYDCEYTLREIPYQT